MIWLCILHARMPICALIKRLPGIRRVFSSLGVTGENGMKYGVVFPQTEFGNDPQAIKDYAQTAEGLGYDDAIALLP